jgi:uncharacterized protein with von Willebrand factor type A (vWA) domain
MSPYEILYPGASVEHYNPEPGNLWMARLLEAWPSAVWLNPVPEEHWTYTHSITLIREILGDRMFPLTLKGLDAAMAELTR